MYYAAITLTELAPILTIFVSMLGGFYVLVTFMLNQAQKASEADREERKEMSKAFNRVAVATETGAREAKQRNGHLGEQNVQIAQLVTSQNIDVKKISESNIKIASILSKSALIAAEDRDSLLGNGNQVVLEQVVENQIVNNKESK